VSVTGELSESLADLSGDYSCRLNMLLDEGREDLAVKLADDFERDVLQLLSGS
jgi:tRNA(Met) C34 N-acetyltransferase TmcA